jgi:hypothetical protein
MSTYLFFYLLIFIFIIIKLLSYMYHTLSLNNIENKILDQLYSKWWFSSECSRAKKQQRSFIELCSSFSGRQMKDIKKTIKQRITEKEYETKFCVFLKIHPDFSSYTYKKKLLKQLQQEKGIYERYDNLFDHSTIKLCLFLNFSFDYFINVNRCVLFSLYNSFGFIH